MKKENLKKCRGGCAASVLFKKEMMRFGHIEHPQQWVLFGAYLVFKVTKQ